MTRATLDSGAMIGDGPVTLAQCLGYRREVRNGRCEKIPTLFSKAMGQLYLWASSPLSPWSDLVSVLSLAHGDFPQLPRQITLVKVATR